MKINGKKNGHPDSLIFQEKAQLLATDDDTCRRNRIRKGYKSKYSTAGLK